MEMVTRVASQRAVVIFSNSSCCMCHAVKTLFQELGVNAAVYELDEETDMGKEVENALRQLIVGRSNKSVVPAVFIGGKFIGSTNNIMSLHMNQLEVYSFTEATWTMHPPRPVRSKNQ